MRGISTTQKHKIGAPFQRQLHPPPINSMTCDLLDFSLSIYWKCIHRYGGNQVVLCAYRNEVLLHVLFCILLFPPNNASSLAALGDSKV